MMNLSGFPISTMFLSPGVTPWKTTLPGVVDGANNPGIRIFEYDPQTLLVKVSWLQQLKGVYAQLLRVRSVNTSFTFIGLISIFNCRMWWPIIWTWLMRMQPEDVGKKSIAWQRVSECQTLLRPPCIRFWSAWRVNNATYKSTTSSTQSAMTWSVVTATVVLTTCVPPEPLTLIGMNCVW